MDGHPFDLVVQLQIWSKGDMYEIAKPLLQEIGGANGLGYTAWFMWIDRNRVKEFFSSLGYETIDIDQRAEGCRKKNMFNKMLNREPGFGPK